MLNPASEWSTTVDSVSLLINFSHKKKQFHFQHEKRPGLRVLFMKKVDSNSHFCEKYFPLNRMVRRQTAASSNFNINTNSRAYQVQQHRGHNMGFLGTPSLSCHSYTSFHSGSHTLQKYGLAYSWTLPKAQGTLWDRSHHNWVPWRKTLPDV